MENAPSHYEHIAHSAVNDAFMMHSEIVQCIVPDTISQNAKPSLMMLSGIYKHADDNEVTVSLMREFGPKEEESALLFFDEGSTNLTKVLAHITPNGCFGTDMMAERIDDSIVALLCDLIQRTEWNGAKTELFASFYSSDKVW